MRDLLKAPTVDDPLESWCAICANRRLPPEDALCHDCRPLYRRFQEGIARKPSRRIARAIFGDRSESAIPSVNPGVPPTPK
jgi:hypothetical protein